MKTRIGSGICLLVALVSLAQPGALYAQEAEKPIEAKTLYPSAWTSWRPYEPPVKWDSIAWRWTPEAMRALGVVSLTRWLSLDPLADEYPAWSPYNYALNNPLKFIDPNGEYVDYFQNQNGDIIWLNSTEATVNRDGTAWTNIGTEYLSFNGQELTYHYQSGQPGNLNPEQITFSAVSGRPIKDLNPFTYDVGTGQLHTTLPNDLSSYFDYSSERQLMPDVGPIPEGTYSVNPRNIQQIGPVDFIAGYVGRGGWPGSVDAWGPQRVWIDPGEVYLPTPSGGTVRRYGFSIHSGSVPGSAGCIDICSNSAAFFQRLAQSPANRVTLQVRY